MKAVATEDVDDESDDDDCSGHIFGDGSATAADPPLIGS